MGQQFSYPIVLDSLFAPFKAKRLERIRGVAPGSLLKFPEKLLQDLIHADPEILPVEELDEYSFTGLRPICQELGLDSKFVDNLLINPDGRICMVECKLWRNPEAVREVVAQILDYAARLARLSYSQLQTAAAKASNRDDHDFLVQTVLGEGAPEEQKVAFIDAVSQSLRSRSFLLLIVGDGIRPELQQITDLLNRPTLGFSLALIEMAFYSHNATGPFYVQPRVVVRTEIVKRTVFVMADKQGKLSIDEVSEPPQPQTISELGFFEKLGAVDPSYPKEVSELLASVEAAGCVPQLRTTYLIYAESFFGLINLGQINSDGTAIIWGSAGRDKKIGYPIGHEYMTAVAAFLPSTDVKDIHSEPGQWYVRYRGKTKIPLKDLLAQKTEWLAAMGKVVERLHTIPAEHIIAK